MYAQHILFVAPNFKRLISLWTVKFALTMTIKLKKKILVTKKNPRELKLPWDLEEIELVRGHSYTQEWGLWWANPSPGSIAPEESWSLKQKKSCRALNVVFKRRRFYVKKGTLQMSWIRKVLRNFFRYLREVTKTREYGAALSHLPSRGY